MFVPNKRIDEKGKDTQVNEVVGIMRVNVEKVLERDQKLSELDSRADALQEGGKRFEQQAQKLKRKYWWKNIKMMIIMGVIGLIILIIIIISIANAVKGDDTTSSSVTSAPPK
ncbi:synaptobrevin [Diabrotica virgifera virgifera]|uniref:V-SNARE coiled-coil homology domain-containing protein n=1 Tax=Diabrotica virgifera virgifera TaxID=50390 RepID=A0ABM5KRY8_DIAVI|nr:synaptobrevin [Diabrotica virgifera virgifera]